MKKLLSLLVLVPIAVLAGIPLVPTDVTLEWTASPTWETNTTVKIWHSTDVTVPKANWEVMAAVTGTNRVTLQIVPGEHYFYATATNFWGESDPSNVALTPPLPQGDNLQIRRGK